LYDNIELILFLFFYFTILIYKNSHFVTFIPGMSNSRPPARFFLWPVDSNINEQLIEKKNYIIFLLYYNYISERYTLCYFPVLSKLSSDTLINCHLISTLDKKVMNKIKNAYKIFFRLICMCVCIVNY